jgi:hypothetical protein
VKATAGLGFALFHSAFPLVLDSRFGLDSRGAGLLMSYVGVLAITGAWAAGGRGARRGEAVHCLLRRQPLITMAISARASP